MKKLIILVLCIWGVIPLLKGQILKPEVITSTGDAYQTPNGQLEWNMGEPIIGSINNSTYSLHQGFFGFQSNSAF